MILLVEVEGNEKGLMQHRVSDVGRLIGVKEQWMGSTLTCWVGHCWPSDYCPVKIQPCVYEDLLTFWQNGFLKLIELSWCSSCVLF